MTTHSLIRALSAGAISLILSACDAPTELDAAVLDGADPAVETRGLAADGPLTANTQCLPMCVYGSCPDDCNRCTNVLSAFDQIRTHGESIGYRMGDMPDVSRSNHWQGVQRLPAHVGGGRYMVVSNNQDDNAWMAVVKMGSRATGGARYRSNRLAIDRVATDVAPPPADTVVNPLMISGIFDHAGGMQAIGRYVGVPLEGGGYDAHVVLWDMAAPEQPTMAWGKKAGSDHAGAVALAKLKDGRHLMVVGRWDSRVLEFYLSNGAPLGGPGSPFTAAPKLWGATCTQHYNGSCLHYRADATTLGDDATWGKYQNLNLLPDCSGALYLLGSHGDLVGDDNWVDLFRVDAVTEGGAITDITLTKVRKKNLTCKDITGEKQCAFLAAGGVYTDPSGRLVLYGAEHDNDGPGGSVKMTEFSPAPGTSCATDSAAWIELYQHTGYGGHRMVVDWGDRALRDHRYLHTYDFGDRTSSVRYCLPAGKTAELYEHSGLSGRRLVLTGTGAPAALPDLHGMTWTGASGSPGDEVSGLRFNF